MATATALLNIFAPVLPVPPRPRPVPGGLVAGALAGVVGAGRNAALQAANGMVVAPAPAAPPVNQPQEFRTGDRAYYRNRHNDFVRRHPNGQAPPDYYLQYGDKYATRFNDVLRPQLSQSGRRWLDRTFVNLQDEMERERRRDPAAFARLEENPDAFRRFAYETHARAYLNAGLADLPTEDLIKIGSTPDFRDLLTRDGLGQVGEVLRRIYQQRGLGYFLRRGAQAAVEFGNPITGPMAAGRVIATGLRNHPEVGAVAAAGIAPGPAAALWLARRTGILPRR